MKNRKKWGTGIAIIAAAATLGATVYAVGGGLDGLQEEKQRITLDSAIDLNANTALEDSATAVAAAENIEQIPVQQETASSLPDIKSVAKNVMPAIVAITSVSIEDINFFGRRLEAEGKSSGSGIIVAKSDDELLIATNNHVVEGSEELTVCFSVEMDDEADEEKKLVPALVKGTDSSMDLAVIAVKLDDIDAEVAEKIGIVQLGDSDKVEVGEWAVAIGNALGYGQSVTTGIISALDREVTVETSNGTVTNNMIQTDAAINFGNSGGALLDLDGRLIGINSAKAAVSGVEGMGYAIPINTAKPIIEDLMNQTTRNKVDDDKAGALGVYVRNVSEEAQQLYNVPSGALVYGLSESNSAARDAGIQQNDIITKLDQTKISNRNELLDRMQYYEAGETVTVTIYRFEDNRYVEHEIPVQLGKKSDTESSSSNQSDAGDYWNDSDDYYDDYNDRDNGTFDIGDLFGSFGF